MKSIKVLWTGVAVLAAVGTRMVPAIAQTEAVPASPTNALLPLGDDQLQAETALQTPITHDAAAQPLTEMLTELSKQSGVVIEVGDNAPEVKVTAHLEKMKLADVLDALTGLYSVHWAKSGDKTFRLLAANPLDARLRRIGDPQWLRFYQQRADLAPPHIKSVPPIDWLNPIYNIADEEKLLMRVTSVPTEKKVVSPEGGVSTSHSSHRVVSGGLPFSEVPPDLQQQLRSFVESKVGLQLAKFYVTRQRKLRLFEQSALLHMEYPTGPGAVLRDGKGREFKQTPAPEISLRTATGEVVSGLPFMPLKSSFALRGPIKEWEPPKPSPDEQAVAP